ncbi:AAA family ATPase [Paenibacillus terrae]|uniref:AAA family ATPase n=1 Tax=Paenibacillus terrae TaxID=159743 RepID=UPI0005CBCFB1|nr:AAA family ATPase [Paenibacillus terrae]
MQMDIKEYLNAGYPALWIQDWEEDRVCNDLRRIAEEGKRKGNSKASLNYFEWSCTKGFFNPFTNKIIEDTTDPSNALQFVGGEKTPDFAIFVFKNFHPYLENPNTKYTIIQLIKDLIPTGKLNERHLIFVSSQVNLPLELSKDITHLQFDLPEARELGKVLNGIISSVVIGSMQLSLDKLSRTEKMAVIDDGIKEMNISEEDRYRLIQAAQGLTQSEAENAFALTWVRHKSFTSDEAVTSVQKIKTQFINSSGFLEYIPPKTSLDDIGGLEELKNWLITYEKAFTKEAMEFGLPRPKGIICTGQPGTGKSAAAQAASAAWKIPLLRFDVGAIFSSLLGETEQKLCNVLKTAEALAPCILQIDEIEKQLSGISSGSSTDGGTTSRVGATLLTWMQEKTKPVFVFGTANDISKLDPALIRKGRFNEIFFIDLPTDEERAEIFAIHIRKRGRNPEMFDLNSLVGHSEGYGGAEIESAIEDALWAAFNEDKREVLTGDIIHALQQTIPVSITKKETIEHIREWAKGRARNASASKKVVEIKSLSENYRKISH